MTITEEAREMGTGLLAGRRALVTGGSRGIGAGIVRRLAADGAAVAFTYASSADAAQRLAEDVGASGITPVAIRADSADPDAAEAAVEQAAAELGALDVLVNNAGTGTFKPIDELSREEFDRLIALNISGVYWTSRAAARQLGEGGRIITIGSVNADRVPTAGTTAYATTKGAVSSMTLGLARELGPRGITVNNVQPGPIATDLNPDEGDFADTLRAITALGRYGRTEEVASLVSFLAGRESSYITGADINVDGGFGV